MLKPSDTETSPASGGKLAVIAPQIVWAIWVVFPSLVIQPLEGRSNAVAQIIAGQVGSSAVPYLEAAPRSLLVYLLASHLVALPALLLLTRSLRARVVERSTPMELVVALLRSLALWLALYIAGIAVVVVTMLLRGADGVLLLSWGMRLGWYGFVSTLPQAGWAFGLALVCRRAWRLVAIAFAGAMSAAILGSALLTQQSHFPTPLWLRAQLMSGQAGASAPAALGLAVWAIFFVCAGVAIRSGRARQRARGALHY